MADLEVDLQGFTSMAAKLRAIVSDETDKLAREIAKDYAEGAQRLSPVGHEAEETPGKLKASWAYDVDNIGRHGRVITVTNDCGYAPFVEYGHRVVINGKESGKYARGVFMARKTRKKIKNSMKQRYAKMAQNVQRRMGS